VLERSSRKEYHRTHSNVRERRSFLGPPRTKAVSRFTPIGRAAWLTIAQLCRRWQLGRKTVDKFIDAKLLPAWRVGRRLYRVAVADVLRFEAENKF
jgi:excisionase family DNA binding protein